MLFSLIAALVVAAGARSKAGSTYEPPPSYEPTPSYETYDSYGTYDSYNTYNTYDPPRRSWYGPAPRRPLYWVVTVLLAPTLTGVLGALIYGWIHH